MGLNRDPLALDLPDATHYIALEFHLDIAYLPGLDIWWGGFLFGLN
jgi:hypothetical protein